MAEVDVYVERTARTALASEAASVWLEVTGGFELHDHLVWMADIGDDGTWVPRALPWIPARVSDVRQLRDELL